MLAQLNLSDRARRGLSLVELMVVIAIMGIVLAVAIPSFGDMLARKRVQLVAAELASDLAFARSESGLKPKLVLVYFNSNPEMSCYSVTQVTAGMKDHCDCTRAVGSVCKHPDPTFPITMREIKTTQVPKSTGVKITVLQPDLIRNGITGLSFTPPSLQANFGNLIVEIESDRGTHPKLQISLNAMGRVKICSPNSSFTGVQTCNN